MHGAHEIPAFRHVETLALQIYEATDNLPRSAPAPLIQRLRETTSTITADILDAWTQRLGEARRRGWHQAIRHLEAFADRVDEAADLGFLNDEQVFELNKTQTHAMVEILDLRECGPMAVQFPVLEDPAERWWLT